ncbi:MAG TPA: hypothetical protein VGQ76_07590 [Thermoanaerobaculia bacterium]|nr:hypothetical protein [Thermoanaerobaculia bacterium]
MNTNRIVRVIHRLAVITIVASFALATTAAAQPEKHNPYTVRGHQIRTNLIPEAEASAYSTMEVSDAVGPTLFQEMVPCRFVSTLDPDQYPVRWGGQAFQVSESRVYSPIGYMVEGLFRNPCSELIPPTAVALAVRIASYQPNGNGSVYLAPTTRATYTRAALLFKQGYDTMQEANVVLQDKAFVVSVADQSTELTIDIIGFFIPDETVRGAQGEAGPQGPEGPRGVKGDSGVIGVRGEQGTQGDKGDTGERGETGAQGIQGVQGVKGDKGDQGDQGVQGLTGQQGDKGEIGVTGATGAQGLKGDKGEKGDVGPQGIEGHVGARGEKGDQGDRGERGENGAQGAQGVKGDRGEIGQTGAQGAQGVKGDRGERGEIGAAGANGAQGAKGDPGLKGDKGLTGDQGVKGDKGLTGDRGLKGDTGANGTNGTNGAQGSKGDPGAKGDKGVQGDKGIPGDKGLKGDTGAQGPKGECTAGPAGPQGPKGPNGPTGPQGPSGPMGPQGPKGESSCGVHVKVSYCSSYKTIGNSGSVSVSDGDVKSSSVIMLTYFESGGSIPLVVASQNNGSFSVAGSKNTKFKYVIVNP